MVEVKFFSASGPSSGVELSGNRIMSSYGPDVFESPVLLGAAQDISWITTSGGIPIDRIEIQDAGQLNNNKWVDSTGVSISSGARVNLNSVVSSGSGTLNIRVTNGTNINISGAKLYAYDTEDVNNDPSGIWVLSYEIIDTAISGFGDNTWALIDSDDYNFMVDRTVDVGYPAAQEFNYSIGLSVRPKLTQASGFQNFGLFFQFDYS